MFVTYVPNFLGMDVAGNISVSKREYVPYSHELFEYSKTVRKGKGKNFGKSFFTLPISDDTLIAMENGTADYYEIILSYFRL